MPIDKELLELIKERLSDLEDLLMTFPEKVKTMTTMNWLKKPCYSEKH